MQLSDIRTLRGFMTKLDLVERANEYIKDEIKDGESDTSKIIHYTNIIEYLLYETISDIDTIIGVTKKDYYNE